MADEQGLHAPELGVPMDVMRSMASADWHAGHRDKPCSLGTAIPCGCATQATLADFALRLVTGQAQWSTSPELDSALVIEYQEADPEAPQVLAQLTVYGYLHRSEVCTAPDCPNDHEGHGSVEIDVQNAQLRGSRMVGASMGRQLLAGALMQYTLEALAEEDGEYG